MSENLFIPILKGLGMYTFIWGTIILALTALLILGLRKSSAATRYTIWSAAFVILIILPIVSVTVPSWTAITIEESVIGIRTGFPAPDAVVSEHYDEPGKSTPIHPVQLSSNVPVDLSSAINTVNDQPGNSSRWASIQLILFGMWLFISIAFLSKFLIDWLTVRGITARASMAERSDVARIRSSLIKLLSIRRGVQVKLSPEVSMPFAWGILNPIIILPSNADDWTPERLRSVITHELAHIARWDYAFHILIEIVRALYWPNPFIWAAARTSVMERERACDDLVLRLGTPSVEYASDLLHIARFQIENNVTVSAVTMAGEPGLKERINHVMNSAINRSPLPKELLILTMLISLVLVISAGSMTVQTQYWHIPHTTDLLNQLESSDNPEARALAAWWLGEHEEQDAVDHLLKALYNEDLMVKLTAGWALGEIKDHKSIDGLIRVLETEEDFLVREMTVLALGEIEDGDAIDALEDAYHSDPRLARSVIWALGEISHREHGRAEDLRSKIIRNLDVQHWSNQQVWTGKVGHIPHSLAESEDLLIHLQDDKSSTRRDAAFELGFLGIKQQYDTIAESESAVLALIHSLDDSESEVRAAAIWSLDEINPSRKMSKLHFGRKDDPSEHK